MINLEDLNTTLYTISHITNKDKNEIEKFLIANPKGKGLENYLKYTALKNEITGAERTYLIKDNVSLEIVAYFTLKTGLITNQTSIFAFDNVCGIELANFAVNDNYREYNDVIPQIGKYVFSQFVIPLVREISNYVGAEYIYIFALPYNKLMKHYNSMGFERVDRKLERFIHRHVKPSYDYGCIFMYQKIIN